MNRDDIIRMAREAGFITLSINEETWIPYLDRFAGLVAAAEREAVANLVEQMGIEGYGTLAIAVVIRARGESSSLVVHPSDDDWYYANKFKANNG